MSIIELLEALYIGLHNESLFNQKLWAVGPQNKLCPYFPPLCSLFLSPLSFLSSPQQVEVGIREAICYVNHKGNTISVLFLGFFCSFHQYPLYSHQVLFTLLPLPSRFCAQFSLLLPAALPQPHLLPNVCSDQMDKSGFAQLDHFK